jgi:hypothetical protein
MPRYGRSRLEWFYLFGWTNALRISWEHYTNMGAHDEARNTVLGVWSHITKLGKNL